MNHAPTRQTSDDTPDKFEQQPFQNKSVNVGANEASKVFESLDKPIDEVASINMSYTSSKCRT